MKLLLALIFTLLLVGCRQTPMTNAEIITESEKCWDAGLVASQLVSGLTFRTIAVECRNESK